MAHYNMKNPAVKRILQEIKEVQADTSGDLMAEALEADIFEWHFAIRGPPDTEFEGGIYHGRILLPAEYPFKPPAFMMLTPSGRFETGVKICLSISTHHPEQWQPSWSVRTALTALIAFMPSPAGGALGALDFPPEDRRKLAAKSRLEPPKWGSPERQQIISSMHARMLAAEPCKAPPAAPPAEAPAAAAAAAPAAAPPQPQQSAAAAPNEQPAAAAAPAPPSSPQQPQQQQPADAAPVASTSTPAQAGRSSIPQQSPTITAAAAPTPAHSLTQPACPMPTPLSPIVQGQGSAPAAPPPGVMRVGAPAAAPRPAAAPPPDTWGLTVLAVVLGVLIAAILLRKALVAVGYAPPSLLHGAALDKEL